MVAAATMVSPLPISSSQALKFSSSQPPVPPAASCVLQAPPAPLPAEPDEDVMDILEDNTEMFTVDMLQRWVVDNLVHLLLFCG